MLVTISWLTVTFLTKPDDKKTLDTFTETVSSMRVFKGSGPMEKNTRMIRLVLLCMYPVISILPFLIIWQFKFGTLFIALGMLVLWLGLLAFMLKKMARHVATKIGDPGDLPVELVLFPGQYKVAAGEKYATRNLLGQKALKGFSCQYRNREAELTLYLCPLSSPKEAAVAEKAFINGLKPPPMPSPEGEGFLFDDKYFGKGRCLRVGNYLAIARYGMGKKKKGGGFEKALIAEFMDRVMEAAIREKTENALEALMGGAPEKR